jgi:hypothetical protein
MFKVKLSESKGKTAKKAQKMKTQEPFIVLVSIVGNITSIQFV